MKHMKRLIALLLVLTMLVPAEALAVGDPRAKEPPRTTLAQRQEQILDSDLERIEPADVPAADEIVTAIIELEEEPLVSQMAEGRFSAQAERSLLTKQEAVEQEISTAILDGQDVEVVSSYTVVTNGFAAKVPYETLEEIRELPQVKRVYVAPVFKVAPNMPATTTEAGGLENATGYRGEGKVIAIVDSGLAMDHPAFAAAPNGASMEQTHVAEAMERENLQAETKYAVNGKLTASQVYHGGKIPFAFDYADGDLDVNPGNAGDHGTHVAGIASANTGVSADVVGVAPEAQLMIMKVFSSYGNGLATWTDILAAMDDAVYLGADVINMSLGSTCGYSSYDWEDGVAETLRRVTESGVSLSVACGNEYSAAFYNRMGKSHALTQNPDYGTVASPSSYEASLAVASVEKRVQMESSYLTVGERKIAFYDITEAPNVDIPSAAPAFKTLGTDTPLAFEVVPGVGEESDYADVDVQGKIALVARGSITYEQKKNAAKAKGAIGLLVYNNEPGMLYMQMDQYDLPSAAISQADGKSLTELPAEQRTLTISAEQGQIESPTSGLMSDFSSWGVTPELTLKPDITAPGGNIKSTTINGGYTTKSGTSMAAPFVSGAIAVTRQYVEQAHADAFAGAKEERQLVDALLMSTAEPVTVNGMPYSPRKQGAGLVNLDRAMNSSGYLTVPGEARPKLALGDDAAKSGSYTLTFDVHNWSDSPVTYTVGGTVQTDGAEITKQYMNKDVWQVTELPKMLEAQIGGQTVEVGAGQTKSVTVTVSLTAADKAYLDGTFPNGSYVEGFVTLTPDNGTAALSLPYLAFYGDWTRASVIDRGYFWNDLKGEENWATQYTNTAAATSLEHTVDTYLGDNPYHRGVPYLADRSAISPNNDDYMDSLDVLYTGLLRNTQTLTYTIANAEDPSEIYYEQEMDHVSKSVYMGSYYRIVPAGVDDYTKITPWDGKNHGISLPNDSKAIVTVTATLPYTKHEADNECLSWSFPITIDTEEPSIESAKVREENGKFFVDVVVSDNQYVSNICFADASGKKFLKSYPVAEPQAGMTTKVSYDVTGLGQKLTLIVNDYACNRRQMDLKVDGNVDESQVIVPTKTVFTEDFETAEFPANGWTLDSHNEKTWYQGMEYGSKMACCAVSRSAQQNEWLISPVIDLSKEDNKAGLIFDFYANYFWSVEQHNYNLKVKASTDGKTWEDIWQLWDVKNEFEAWEKTQAKVTIPDKFQKSPTLQLAFVYEGSDGTELWMDNVQVYVNDPTMTHTITATAGEGGTIAPEGTVKVSHNMSRSFTITPNPGYLIADVKVDGASVGPRAAYSFDKVTDDHTIEATFSAEQGGDVAVLIDEDFEKQAMPQGWRVSGINQDHTWKVYKYFGHWGAYSPVDTYDPDPAYNCPGNPQDERLILPTLNLSGRDAVSLSFQFSGNKRNLSRGNMIATVEVSTDNGQSWNKLWDAKDVVDSLQEDVISGFVGTGDQVVQIPGEYLKDGVQLAFRYVHPKHSSDGGPVFVDNVKVMANGGGSTPDPNPEPKPPVSDDVLNEDFEGQKLPDGWTIDTTNKANTWKVKEYNKHWGAGVNPDTFDPDDYEMYPGKAQDERLITPAVNLNGKTAALSFQLSAVASMLKRGDMTVTVEGTADDGATWTELWNAKTHTDDMKSDVLAGNIQTGDFTLEIPADFLKDGVKFSFRYQRPARSEDGGTVFVDNVKISAKGGQTPEPPAETFTITASAGQGGSIAPSGKVTVKKGGNQTFAITASEGYELAKVLVDGASVGKKTTYTFKKVDKDHTMEVQFRRLHEELPTAIHEDFNNGESLPDKWTVEGPSAENHYETWKSGIFDALGDTNLMLCTQNVMFAQKQNEKLILPEIQMPKTCKLTFDWGGTYEHLSGGSMELTVQASLDKGSTWSTIWNAAEHLPEEVTGEDVTGKGEVAIPANYCVPGARFAFVFASSQRSDGTAAIDNVHLSADGESPAPSLYAITVAKMEHGTVVPSKSVAAEGETITLTVKPDQGYRLKEGSLQAGDQVVKGNSFTMPAKAVEITALFEKTETPPQPAKGYTDGVYEGEAQGKMGLVKVRVTVTDGAVAKVEVLEQNETPNFWEKAKAMLEKLVGKRDNESIAAVDAVATATVSSEAIKKAVLNALEQAVDTDSGIFAAGDGSEKSPYLIRTIQQLTDFAASVNQGESYKGKYIALDKDLSLKEVDWNPIGTSNHDKYTGFAGTFDGRGHLVSDITCGTSKAPKNVEAMGFFGVIEKGGQVRNLNLQITKYYNVSKQAEMVYVGGLTGILDRDAVIDHCTVVSEDMTISEASSKNCAMGALVGKMGVGSTVANCWTNAGLTYGAMNFNTPLDVSMGGIAGVQAKNSLIVNCASFGSVSGMVMSGVLRVGGLVGQTSGALYNCYTTSLTKANITGTEVDKVPEGTTAIGHLIGSSETGAALYQCYYDKNAPQFSNTDLAGEPEENKPERRQAAGWDPVSKIKTDLSQVTAMTAAELMKQSFADTMNDGAKTMNIQKADTYFKEKNLGTDLVVNSQSALHQGFYGWELRSNTVLIKDTQTLNVSVEDVAVQQDIVVGLNTPVSQLNLPKTVAVTLSTNVVMDLPVTWDTSSYVQGVATTYKFIGVVTLPEGVINPNNHKARITVIVQKDAPKTYTVTVAPMTNGTVEADKTAARAGETVTLTVRPDAGYALKIGSLKANKQVVAGSTFTMPAEDVTITAVFETSTTPPAESEYADGVYEGEAMGKNGLVKVKVTVTNGSVAKIDVVSQNETPSFWEKAKAILADLLGKRDDQSITEVDAIATATVSSEAIKNAVLDALDKAANTDAGIFASGSGTQTDPYVIRTVKQLTDFAASVNSGESYKGKYIALDADLSLKEVSWTPIGTSDHDKFTGFAGTFDGRDHTVSELTCGTGSKTVSYEALGFFGVVERGGQVRNLNVQIDKVYNSCAKADNVYVGGLVGILAQNATVDHCTVIAVDNMAIMDGSGRNGAMGGLVGRMMNGSTVANCWTDANLSLGTLNPAALDVSMGGIAGIQGKNSLIANCASFGSVPGTIINGVLRVGGLVGQTSGALYNCYTTSLTKANITGTEVNKLPAGTTAIGHLIGNSETGAALYQCYYDKNAPQFSNTDLAAEPEEGKPERRQAAGWDPVQKIKTDLSHVTACDSGDLVKKAFADTMNKGLNAKTITQADSYFAAKKLLEKHAVAAAEAALDKGFYRWELVKDRVILADAQIRELTITSVEKQTGKTVQKGTKLEDLKLPVLVEVTLSNQNVLRVEVQWSCKNYNAAKPGSYTFIGKLINLPNNVLNPKNLTASLVVKVMENPDQVAADKVKNLIDAIGEVTLDKEQQIEQARKAYEKLTEEQKKLVDNLNKLVEAEKRLEELKKPGPNPNPNPNPNPKPDPNDPNPTKPLVPMGPGFGKLPFTDVAQSAWYYDAVKYVYNQRLMNGVTDTLFAPDQTTSRAMIVTVLHRMNGAPKAVAKERFTDVAADSWYGSAVAWGSANNIVGGYGNGKFGPDDNVTREQLVSILYRYAKKMGYDVSASAKLTGFTDAVQVSDWAKDAMEWAYGIGLIDGVGDGRLMPQGNATRAQVAAILMRFSEKVVSR